MEDKKSTLLQLPFLKGRFLFLLISLLFLCFFFPFIPRNISRYLTVDITFIFILLSGIYAISEKKVVFIISLVLALTGFGSRILNYLFLSPSLQLVGTFIYLIFFILMAVVILTHIGKSKKVSADTIYGAVCVYLLLGIIWADLFSVVEMIEPGSFLSAGEPVIKTAGEYRSRPGFENLVYYSFVTLTTLGYGDITPVSNSARSLSSFEAVVGQLYVAVMIARLVGLHIAQADREE
jgi:hypothetical protein